MKFVRSLIISLLTHMILTSMHKSTMQKWKYPPPQPQLSHQAPISTKPQPWPYISPQEFILYTAASPFYQLSITTEIISSFNNVTPRIFNACVTYNTSECNYYYIKRPCWFCTLHVSTCTPYHAMIYVSQNLMLWNVIYAKVTDIRGEVWT